MAVDPKSVIVSALVTLFVFALIHIIFMAISPSWSMGHIGMGVTALLAGGLSYLLTPSLPAGLKPAPP